MTLLAPVEYTSVSAARGPLLVVQGVEGVGWDEVAEVHLGDGSARRGVVLDVQRDLAVVEVLEGTAALRLDELRVAFTGAPMRIPVGEGWLGRVCNGRGDPLDGGPPIMGDRRTNISGNPINPSARDTPSEPILTGVSAIDGLATLVRGQKLPIFSVGGLPHLELAAQVASQARAGDEAFAVVFAAVGITRADAMAVRDALEERTGAGDLTLFLNTADDPIVERIVTPRIALTVGEHLAFELGRHVLVVIADLTSYAEAVREVSAARGEVPSRRGYPGYLYSDLASLYERAGRIKGRPGSLTQVPVLTMPAGDITHPVPDLTGYITEGQIVLSRELHRRGVTPPVDVLPSLSRLMNAGIGDGRTVREHREWANQLYASYSQGREARLMAAVVGEGGLSEADRRALAFAERFEREFVAQERRRNLGETLAVGWRLLETLPRDDLLRLADATWAEHRARAEQSVP
jgi:V/A-type H+-transporting ATPase subunit B